MRPYECMYDGHACMMQLLPLLLIPFMNGLTTLNNISTACSMVSIHSLEQR